MFKRKWQKLITAISVSALAVGMMACGSKGDAPESAASDTGGVVQESVVSEDGTTTSATEETVYPDYSNGFESTVTLQIPVFDRAYEGWNVTDNYYTNWVQTEFGDKYNIDVEFVAISRSSQVQDYMQLLASGQAPDIIFHYDMPQMLAYYQEASMQPIDLNEIAFYAPTYWEKMSNTIETYGQVEGENYFFFADRPDTSDNYITVIRQDWLDAVGMEVPTNLEELNEVLMAWKEAGLGSGGGRLIMNSFTYDYPFRDFEMSEEEHALYSDLAVAAFTWEPTYKYLKNMNYQYNNELIDTEFYLNTDDASEQADFIAGNSGILRFFSSNNSTVIDSLLQNNPEAKLSYLPISALSPADCKPQTRAYWPFGMIMGINQDCTDEERTAVWMYLEWLIQPENLFFFQNGVENENYTIDEAGLPVAVENFAGESKLSPNNNKDYWCLVAEAVTYEDEETTREANMRLYAIPGYEDLLEAAYEEYDAIAEYRTPDALYNVVLDSLTEYKAELTEQWKTLYVECVMAPEEEFDAVYEAACQTYLDAGYQEILDEKQAAIDAGNYR